MEHANHPVIQKAAKAKDNPFHMNEFENGVAVTAWQNTNHPQYNQRIFAILEGFKDEYPNASPEEAMTFLQGKMQSIKQLIEANPNVKLNDLSFR